MSKQHATLSKLRSTLSKQRSTLLPQTATTSNEYRKISFFRQSRNKLTMFSLFRLCRKDEISFDIVAESGNIVTKNGNNVEVTVNIVERIVKLVAFGNVSMFWSLLLVWTGLKQSTRECILLAAPTNSDRPSWDQPSRWQPGWLLHCINEQQILFQRELK